MSGQGGSNLSRWVKWVPFIVFLTGGLVWAITAGQRLTNTEQTVANHTRCIEGIEKDIVELKETRASLTKSVDFLVASIAEVKDSLKEMRVDVKKILAKEH